MCSDVLSGTDLIHLCRDGNELTINPVSTATLVGALDITLLPHCVSQGFVERTFVGRWSGAFDCVPGLGVLLTYCLSMSDHALPAYGRSQASCIS